MKRILSSLKMTTVFKIKLDVRTKMKSDNSCWKAVTNS